MSVDLTAGIVRILRPNGTTAGTGFVVSDDGLIATCAHVVKAAGAGPGDTVRIVLHASGEEREAWVELDHWRAPDAEDVAILRLEGALPEGVAPLPLGSSADAEGCTFHTFGFPEAKPVEGMLGKCEVIGHTTEGGFPVLQLRSSEVTRGFSGAPVWDDTLHVVIGMVVSIVRPDRDGRMAETAFIIPVETLREVCPTLGLPEFCPYRGLQVFEAEHAAYYFGREAATRELLGMLSRRDFVAVVGVSGSGKSSLVRAGLEKGLRKWPVPGLSERPRCLFTPGSTPLLDLVLALAGMFGQTPESVARSLDLPPDILAEGSETRCQATNEDLNGRSPQTLARMRGLVLIVDQFERLYTECQDEDVRRQFIEALLAVAGDEVKVLLALRADFYGLALEHPGLAQAIKRGQVTLLPMNEGELRRAIEEPARVLRRTFQPGLVERLMADVQGRSGDLPLLEFALTELWERDAWKGVLTLESYERLGYTAPDRQRFPGVQGAIAQRAEAVWQALSEEERKAARRVFLGLITPGPVDERGEQIAEDASRRAWQAEWDESAQRVVEKLVAARLLTTGRDPFSGQPTVEVAHEALIRAWPRLQRWVTDYRPFVRWYDHDLASFLHRWLENEKDPSFLLPAPMLEQARYWLAEYPAELSGPPAQYIRASVGKWERERAARERRRRRLTLAAVGAAVIFLILAGLAGVGWWWAEERRQVAEARRLAFQAQTALDNTGTGLVRSMLLATESLRRSPTLEGDQALHRGLALLPCLVARIAQEQAVLAVAFSYDGQWVATGSIDGTARVWEVATGQEVGRMAHGGNVEAVAFSPDGRWLATGSADHTARVWEVTTGQEVARMVHGSLVRAVAFGPDGRLVASAGGWPDNTALVWEAATGRTVAWMVHESDLYATAFSPDGRWLATGSGDGTVRLWDVWAALETGGAIGEEVVWQAHGASLPVYAVTFNPDGRWLATGSEDCTARVWELATGKEVARMAHEWPVRAVAFSPDGRWLATGSWDGTAPVWELATGKEVARMAHQGPVVSVAFGFDGRWVVTGSHDTTVRVWEVVAGQEVARMAHKFEVNAVAFSPDGRWVASRNDDGTVRVWEAATGEEVARMEHEGPLWALAFSPDGRWVASGSGDWGGDIDEVRVWEAATGREVAQMEHEGPLWVVAFSPDGKWLATGSGDDTVRVWEAATGEEVARMEHKLPVRAVAFSPDGRWVASGIGDWGEI